MGDRRSLTKPLGAGLSRGRIAVQRCAVTGDIGRHGGPLLLKAVITERSADGRGENMELWHRALTALVALVLATVVLTVGWWGWRTPRPPSTQPLESTKSVTALPQVSGKQADAIALRTMELLKAREELRAAEARWGDEVRRRAVLTLELERLRSELESLRVERNETLDFALQLLQELQARDLPESPAQTQLEQQPAGQQPGTAAPSDAVVGDLLNEVQQLRSRLEESQSALAALVERTADIEDAALQQQHRITQAAIRVLRQTNSEAAVAALIAELQSPYAEIRRWAARSLEGLGPDAQQAIEPLNALLADPDSTVREAAAAALRAIHD